MRPKLILIYSVALVFIMVAAGIFFRQALPEEPARSDDYCQKDEDCACGEHIETGQCFVGNRQLVQPSGDCFEFCHQRGLVWK